MAETKKSPQKHPFGRFRKHKTDATLTKKIQELELQSTEYLNGWKRAQADLANAEKRNSEMLASRVKLANKDLILQLIPVMDNFDRAFEGLEVQKTENAWMKGFEHIHRQFQSVLEEVGAKRFSVIGEKFDPARHEAMGNVAGEKDVVITEVLPGYTLNGEIIRHAKVNIGSGKPDTNDPHADENHVTGPPHKDNHSRA